jgi:hypothetical protein
LTWLYSWPYVICSPACDTPCKPRPNDTMIVGIRSDSEG